MKKKKLKWMNYRCWIEVFVIMAVLGVIFVNGLYLDGYEYMELTYESGSLLGEVRGYTAENNTFQYTGDEESYVQIAGVEELDQILLAFDNQAEKDTEVTFYYVDDEGNIDAAVSQATWKKGDFTVKINTIEGQHNSYLLYIPANFTLSRAYYAVENDYHGVGKWVWFLMALVVALCVSAVIMCMDCTSAIVERADQKAIDALHSIWDNKKTVGGRVLAVVGIVLAGVLVSFVVSRFRHFVFSGKLAFMGGIVGAMFALFILFYRSMAKKVEVAGFIIILLTGSLFAFLEPPNVGLSWDDEIHLHNAVRLSHLADNKISAADLTTINDYTKVALVKSDYHRSEQKRTTQLMDELVQSKYYAERGELSGILTQAAYLPSAAGMAVARGIGLPFYATLVAGRWMNTWLLAILAYLAMKRLQSGKIVVMLIALLPTNIFMAGNYTYDTWLVAWSILGLSAFFGEWQQPEKKMDKWTPWLIGISMYLAVLPKQVYFPLTLIALFLPRSKFKDKKQCRMYRTIVLLSALLPLFTVYIQNIANGMGSGEIQGDIRGGEAVNAAGQLEYMRTNPGQTAKMLYHFLKIYLNPMLYGAHYMTNIAYFGFSPMNLHFLMGVVVAGALVSRNEGEKKFPWWSKAGVLLEYVAIGTVVAVSMYVSFTAVGADTVAGCQGRYLLPVLFPVLYVLSRFSFRTWVKNTVREENINILLIILMVAGSVWGLWTGCLCFY